MAERDRTTPDRDNWAMTLYHRYTELYGDPIEQEIKPEEHK